MVLSVLFHARRYSPLHRCRRSGPETRASSYLPPLLRYRNRVRQKDHNTAVLVTVELVSHFEFHEVHQVLDTGWMLGWIRQGGCGGVPPQ